MTNKPPFAGEGTRRVRLGEVLRSSFSGEWGSEGGEEKIAILRTANFNVDGSMDYSSPAFRCVSISKVEKKLLKRGDVIIEKSGGTPRRPVGIVAFFNSDMKAVCSNFNQVLRFDVDRIVPIYAFYQLHWLHSKGAFERFTRKTTGLQNLQMSKFQDLSMVLPSMEEQKAAVQVFGRLVELKHSRNRSLALLDELVKSRFVEMFGDGMGFPRCLMSDLVINIISGSNVKGIQRPLGEDEYAVLKISSVTKGEFAPTEYKVVETKNLPSRMVHPRKGDLLFSRANTSEMVGATAIVNGNYEQLFLPDKLWRLDPASDVETVFLKYLLSSQDIRMKMSKLSTGTSGSMQNISMTKFRKLSVFKPPLSLQREFAAFASEVDKSRVVVQKQIEKLQTLYDSLAQEYFG